MRFGCYFVNFDYTVHFSTFREAVEHGKKSGFEFVITERSI